MGVVWVQTPAAGVRTYGDIMAEQQLAKAQVLKSEFYTKYISVYICYWFIRINIV